MRPWHTLTGDRAEHAERRRGTARVSDAARQSQAGAPAEAKDRLSRARLGAAGGGGGWRGVLLVSALLLSGRAGAVGATTCEKSTFAYSSGPCEGVEFKVARCAESADELKAWIKVSPLTLTRRMVATAVAVDRSRCIRDTALKAADRTRCTRESTLKRRRVPPLLRDNGGKNQRHALPPTDAASAPCRPRIWTPP